MKRLMVRGINCTHMESMAVAMQRHPASCKVGEFLRSELAVMVKANRVYLKKRGTVRLLQLLKNSFWKAPFRSALIFEVLNTRACAAKARAYPAIKAPAPIA